MTQQAPTEDELLAQIKLVLKNRYPIIGLDHENSLIMVKTYDEGVLVKPEPRVITDGKGERVLKWEYQDRHVVRFTLPLSFIHHNGSICDQLDISRVADCIFLTTLSMCKNLDKIVCGRYAYASQCSTHLCITLHYCKMDKRTVTFSVDHFYKECTQTE